MDLGRFQFAKYMEYLRVNILKERIPRGLYYVGFVLSNTI